MSQTIKPEDVKPEELRRVIGNKPFDDVPVMAFPTHEVGAIIKECMEDAREHIETAYESWHRNDEIERRAKKYFAWLAKAEELERMK